MADSVPFHEKTQLLSSVDKTDASTVASVRSGSMTTQHKMQVHAEVTYTKRRPSIESGATSLGERINYEDASVKALAGSTYYDDKVSLFRNFFFENFVKVFRCNLHF